MTPQRVGETIAIAIMSCVGIIIILFLLWIAKFMIGVLW